MTNIILSDEELQAVTGGANKKIKFMKVACTKCSKVFEVNTECSSAKCPFCKMIHSFAG